MNKVIARSPAKINLALHVGPRQKSGYHNLTTVFQAVDLWETVSAEHSDDFRLTLTGNFRPGEIPLDNRNLAFVAAKKVASISGYTGAVSLEIDKQVPVAGGMAGGSADAAATLVAVNALWKIGLSREQLMEIASEIGSDVPFAMQGATQIGRGRGQLLERVDSKPFFWVAVAQNFGLSTASVFKALDQLRTEESSELVQSVSPALLQALTVGDPEMLAGELINELQEGTFVLKPELRRVLSIGKTVGSLAGVICGSGPTCLFLAREPKHQTELVEAFRDAGFEAVTFISPVEGAHLLTPESLSQTS
tara:strand:+ start:11 stop:931 length:921 start_codon:yes stop_codon:yes gene_type:complete